MQFRDAEIRELTEQNRSAVGTLELEEMDCK
jgi:hypothetical protein